jgi:hypothetical protein
MSEAPFSRRILATSGKVVVGAGKERKPDEVHILLQCRFGDGLRGLPDACVDDLHAGVPKGPGYVLGSPVMAVKPRLSNKNPCPAVHGFLSSMKGALAPRNSAGAGLQPGKAWFISCISSSINRFL